MAVPRIDSARLLRDINETARIGATSQGGICRLALSPDDVRARRWLAQQAGLLGATVRNDQIGNMFALLPGTVPGLAPLAFGSHLDTQPTGGRFDGILGVLAGLAALRALHAAGHRARHPLCLVNWTNEEGARFSPTMLGSGVHAGIYGLDAMRDTRDQTGTSLGSALDDCAMAGPMKPGSLTFAAWLELHIEQGPVLESRGLRAAAVRGVQGLRWYDLRLTGRAAHAGTTPRQDRQDAFLAAARLALAIEAIACKAGGLATFGQITMQHASRNVVAHDVLLSVDLRHPDAAGLDEMEAAMRHLLKTPDPSGVRASVERIAGNAPVVFDLTVVNAVRAALADEGLADFTMISGAGHDAVNIAPLAPSAMIFVPSRDGLSHNPAEFTTPEDCVLGAQLLLNALLRLDQRLTTD